MYALRAINPALVSPFQRPRIFHSEQCIFAILPQLAAAKHDALAERGGAARKNNPPALLAAAKPMRFGAAGKGLHKS
jgi:hypothetical protein